jgi:hypothetical protein
MTYARFGSLSARAAPQSCTSNDSASACRLTILATLFRYTVASAASDISNLIVGAIYPAASQKSRRQARFCRLHIMTRAQSRPVGRTQAWYRHGLHTVTGRHSRIPSVEGDGSMYSNRQSSWGTNLALNLQVKLRLIPVSCCTLHTPA